MNERLTQCLKRAAQVSPRRTATICGSRTRTWSEIEQRVARAAAGLRALGVQDGARVAILAMNSDRYFEAYFAVPWAGGTLLPLNTRLTAADLEYMMNDAEAGVICIDESFTHLLPGLRERCPQLRHVIYLGDDPERAVSLTAWDAVVDRSEPMEDADRHSQDIAGIFYTGGSTGRPKGVMLSHGNLVANAVNAICMIGYDASSVFLHAAPMCHLTDGMSTVAITMAAGTHVFIPKFDAQQVLEQIQANKVTNVTLVPTMIAMMLEVPGIEHMQLSSLKQFMFGSAPMPEATLQRAVRIWPDILFLHGWGMTELSPIGTMLPMSMRKPAIAGQRLRSCGQPMPNIELRIVDVDDKEVPRGKTGEIVVRGPIVMQGYWKKPAETAAAIRDGWFHTGDAAVMDEDGYVYIVDRLKDMIISGGENIYSTEVENAISLMPGVAEVAVIGVPDDKWGERVHAIVVPREGADLTPEEVQAWAREKIASYKVPRSVLIRRERLPLSGAGKVLKSELRAPYWAGRDKKI
ncbi:long-chain fatty acid--CoA ligase [Ramlibacter tataouinensis]|uniref:class I adenylate-forming enzyme family protein n=1 Tax=Ramlibacter tataouinensis TaxID=94132 RepID=UPI0022F3E12E|nr:long-chain fatty acid--CoA ligase [Ramlibacter tataouinensis]WBY02941.1 long-chain fatty acid--CoA ligase [Ramlibacter tataouinensis]